MRGTARALATLGFLLLLAPPPLPAASQLPQSPVAVLPFKNLNADASIDWLRAGIAETMITDLRKSSRVQVVERDQVDQAIAEIALQEQGDDAASVKVGKLVGAKTLVLGSFQEAGGELRINARFVAVETGVVLDTAKTTGPATKVFSLQDQVVDRLLGVTPALRPKRKATQKTLDAYRLYSLALSVASDADREGYLKQSLGSDPDFVYAKDDLAALETRLNGYRDTRQANLPPPPELSQRKLMEDTTATPRVRTTAAMLVLNIDLTQRRYRALIEDSLRILALNLPTNGNLDPNAQAAWCLMQAYAGLNQPDLAMKAGEAFLKDYPTSSRFPSADHQMRQMIEARRAVDQAQARMDKHFAELDAQRARVDHRQQVGLDLQKCSAPGDPSTALYQLSLDQCRHFIQTWSADTTPGTQAHLLQARYQQILDLAELGRWQEAIPAAQSFVAEQEGKPNPNPAGGWATALKRKLIQDWPVDAVP